MLQLGAISVVFFCLSTVTTSVLQGLDDMITPVKNSAIALVIHVVSLLLMMVVFEWNIYAVVLSKIVFAGALCILNAQLCAGAKADFCNPCRRICGHGNCRFGRTSFN